MAEIKFGTDGWRAVIGKDFTFENVKIVMQAISDHINTTKKKDNKPYHMVIGYDTRFLSEDFAATAAEVLCGNGIKTLLSKTDIPTPAACLAIKNRKLDGGIIITASHNPHIYNGIKYRGAFAGPVDPEITKEVEGYLGKNEPKTISLEEAETKELLETEDLTKDHVSFLRQYVDLALLKKSSMKVIIDVMNGSGSGLLEKVLRDTKMSITTINGERNPYFRGRNPEPIASNLEELLKAAKKSDYDVGLAIDGDADRIGAVDEGGNFVSCHKIISLILLHFIEDRKMTGSVVKTVSGTSLITKIAKKYKLKLHETPVGFKYICKVMREEDVLIGGEESGGIGFKNYVPEKDGLLSGLLLLEMMAYRKKGLQEILKDIEKEYGMFFTDRIDTEYPEEKKKKLVPTLKTSPPKKLLDKKVIDINTSDGIKFICEDESWLLFRLSGTEPILRIYAEASSKKKLDSLLEEGKKISINI